MKKIFLILSFVFLFNISNVFAYVNGQKFTNYLQLYTTFQGWTGPSTYNNLGTAYHSDSTGINTNNQVSYYYLSDPNLYNDTNGTSLKSFINGQFVKDNNFELSIGVCSTIPINFIDTIDLYLTDTSGNPIYQTIKSYKSNDLGLYETEVYTFYCKEYYINFSATINSTSYWFKFYSSTIKPMGLLSYMGYNLTMNGQDYTSQFNNLTNQSSTIITQNNYIANNTDTIINQNQQTQQKLDDIDNTITDESGPNTGALGDSAGWLPAGPVDSILNLPLTMFQSLSDNIGSSCTPLIINLPYVDKNITLPCLNSIYEQIDGLSVWINSIGIIASAFILYSYLLKLYKWVDDTLTFRENNHIDNWGGI